VSGLADPDAESIQNDCRQGKHFACGGIGGRRHFTSPYVGWPIVVLAVVGVSAGCSTITIVRREASLRWIQRGAAKLWDITGTRESVSDRLREVRTLKFERAHRLRD